MNCMGVPVAPLWVYVRYRIIDLLSNRYLDKVQYVIKVQGSRFKTSASFKACDGGPPALRRARQGEEPRKRHKRSTGLNCFKNAMDHGNHLTT